MTDDKSAARGHEGVSGASTSYMCQPAACCSPELAGSQSIANSPFLHKVDGFCSSEHAVRLGTVQTRVDVRVEFQCSVHRGAGAVGYNWPANRDCCSSVGIGIQIMSTRSMCAVSRSAHCLERGGVRIMDLAIGAVACRSLSGIRPRPQATCENTTSVSKTLPWFSVTRSRGLSRTRTTAIMKIDGSLSAERLLISCWWCPIPLSRSRPKAFRCG